MIRIALLILLTYNLCVAQAQQAANVAQFPLRGFCIAAPVSPELPAFERFIEQELAPRQVNVLILRVDYNYAFEKRPELRDSSTLSKEEVKRLVALCKRHQIKLIPQINLLGHQSWAGQLNNLLQVYPQFDETPHVEMPEKYNWPNADGLYCKSYCPLHPDVHAVVFDLVDEVCDAFESEGFHAGMDEVFYIGDDKCPRCSGRDKAELFAGEVRRIRDHLATRGRRLWIWGDRLIDGKETGLGMWEASMNNTHRAIDMIPKDVMICDWHYERADKTAVLFAMKGFDVVTCPWRNPGVAQWQVEDMDTFIRNSTPEMSARFQGIVQTVWSDTRSFLDGYYTDKKDSDGGTMTPWACFKTIFPKKETPKGKKGKTTK